MYELIHGEELKNILPYIFRDSKANYEVNNDCIDFGIALPIFNEKKYNLFIRFYNWIKKTFFNKPTTTTLEKSNSNIRMKEVSRFYKDQYKEQYYFLEPEEFITCNSSLGYVNMPDNIRAEIAIRSYAAKSGLNQVTSQTIRAGYKGLLILELKNFLNHHILPLSLEDHYLSLELYKIAPYPSEIQNILIEYKSYIDLVTRDQKREEQLYSQLLEYTKYDFNLLKVINVIKQTLDNQINDFNFTFENTAKTTKHKLKLD